MPTLQGENPKNFYNVCRIFNTQNPTAHIMFIPTAYKKTNQMIGKQNVLTVANSRALHQRSFGSRLPLNLTNLVLPI